MRYVQGLDLAISIADLLSVDAAVVADGVIRSLNTSLARRMRTEQGWKKTKEVPFWEIFDNPSSEIVRDWYKMLKIREESYGSLTLRSGKDDETVDDGTVHSVALDGTDLIVIDPPGTVSTMAQMRELERVKSIFECYLDSDGIGFMVLQDEDRTKGVIRSITEVGARLFERDVGDLIGLPIGDVLTPESSETLSNLVQAIERNGSLPSTLELHVTTTKGDPISIVGVFGKTIWKDEDALFCVFRDETSDRIIVNELMKFAHSFDVIDDMLVIADGQLNVLYINPSGLARTGFVLEEVQGRPINRILSRDPIEYDLMALAEVLWNEGSWKGEGVGIHEDGSMFPVAISAVVVPDVSGEPEMVVVHSKDIMRSVEAERSVHKTREMTEFLVNLVTHNIKEHLDGIGEWVEELAAVTSPNTKVLGVDAAKDQVAAISKLIKWVERLSHDRAKEKMKPMDLAKIIQKIVGDIESKHPDASIKMKRSLLRSPMMVMADELLEELLYAIVEDAVKHQGDEEVVLQLTYDQVPDTDRKSIRLSIADHKLKVKAGESFSIFYSVVPREGENGEPRRSLELALSLVERYEGRVWMEDRVHGDWDEGSKVVVEFPHA